MNIVENVSLRGYSAMGLGGKARFFSEAHSEDDLKKLIDWAKEQNLPVIVVGEGSNIVWRDEGFEGLLIANHITGREVLDDGTGNTTIRIGAGENWDEIVDWTVKKGLSGIEFLSAIPGRVGAAPVQNIGAYGTEIAQTLVELAAFDTHSEDFVTIKNKACGFAYRTSRFKTDDKGRFIITSITLKLSKTSPSPPFYESLEKYLTEHKIKDHTPRTIREAVMAIRAIKLPSPAKVANNGSFFTNPVIGKKEFEKLQKEYPDIKGWPHSDKVKVSAGWLLEEAGFKGVHDKQTGMATWPAQALVLINEHAKTTADLLSFKQKIQSKVHAMFGIVLEQEPELLP
ncbi:MAG: UDP-N-acetylmuramate dehydrogenase [bacterium]|nr:UDP-N-acetylmuramate dehydrogenase [bacterium]